MPELWLAAPAGSRPVASVDQPDGPAVRVRSLAVVLDRSGELGQIPIERVDRVSDRVMRVSGAALDFRAAATLRAADGACPHWEVELELFHGGREDVECGLRIGLELAPEGPPRWLVPGIFYGENRVAACRRLFPRYEPGPPRPDEMVSGAWSFRADRTPLPAVFAWSTGLCAALATDETSALGPNGLGFAGDDAGRRIWLDLPFREEPIAYRGAEEPDPPDVRTHSWRPGEHVALGFEVYVADGDPHAYDRFVRWRYGRDRAQHGLAPWVGGAQAADLAASGLWRWHHDPGPPAVLRETAAFDRESGAPDRPDMHVAWVSGAPYAAALLGYGRYVGDERYRAAGSAVLDTIAAARAPCGTFWGRWRAGGWDGGWTPGGGRPGSGWLHANTVATATLFLLRAAADEAVRGERHEAWEAAAHSSLDFALRCAGADGTFGTYYDPLTGAVTERDGAGGLPWVAALIAGAERFGEERYRTAAERAGAGYAHYVLDESIYGAPEDVHLAPTSEDGYNAVIAYTALFRATGGERWLDLARRAAEWTFTFRWTYNVAFPAETLLGRYDFRTRGADVASPANQHLHPFGLICLPELVELSRATGDAYYRDRAIDNLQCFRQFIARADGDFGAYRGMVSERWYHTDCFQAKGMLLSLSHAWCVGLVLSANLYAVEHADALS